MFKKIPPKKNVQKERPARNALKKKMFQKKCPNKKKEYELKK